MIMSRHGFIGTGQFGSKWLGEYKADWNNMRRFIVSNLEMSMFGFSMVFFKFPIATCHINCLILIILENSFHHKFKFPKFSLYEKYISID